jgi:glycosyltransferase involved in cell wall biosynthesis
MDQKNKTIKLSIVIPMFNESENIKPLVEEIKKCLPVDIDYEFILVDDGSRDETFTIASKLAQKDNKIRALSFYRNFGHQAALTAGLSEAKGDIILTMDSDFQHPPDQISAMINKWREGFDLVVAQKENDPTKNIFIKFIRYIGYKSYSIIGDKIIPGVSDFRLMDRNILDYVLRCNEVNAVLRGLVMIPAKKIYIHPYKVHERRAGKSGYTISKLFNLFLYTVTSFSLKPLRLASILGFALVLLSFVYLLFILFAKFILEWQIIEGWTALIFCVLLLFGFNFLYLGILSEYIGIIFWEVKRRPKYIVHKRVNI